MCCFFIALVLAGKIDTVSVSCVQHLPVVLVCGSCESLVYVAGYWDLDFAAISPWNGRLDPDTH